VLVGCGSGSGDRLVSVPWRTAGDLEAGLRDISVTYTFPGYVCEYRFARATVRETAETVRIEVLARYRPMPSGQACIAILGGGRTTVHLGTPLGRRRLEHAPAAGAL